MRIVAACLVCFAVSFAHGGVVREISVPSASMDKDVPASVILPNAYYESWIDIELLVNKESES